MRRKSIFGGARFFEQSRRRRKLSAIGVRNRITRHASILGGMFTTLDYMHADMQWADFYFLSSSRNAFFNATAVTTRHHFFEEAHNQATDHSYKLIPIDETPRRWREMFRKRSDGYFEWIPQQEVVSSSFGGLTRRNWVAAEERRLIEAACVSVHEGWSRNYSYRYGTGLSVLLDEPAITLDVLNSFITRFRSMGERDWCSPVARVFNLDDMPADRVQSNLLLDPDEWSTASQALASGR